MAARANFPNANTNSILSYRIQRPNNLPFKCSKHGISVCIADKELAKKMIALLNKYDIYYDRGIIPMPKEIKIRIDLIDSWQN